MFASIFFPYVMAEEGELETGNHLKGYCCSGKKFPGTYRSSVQVILPVPQAFLPSFVQRPVGLHLLSVATPLPQSPSSCEMEYTLPTVVFLAVPKDKYTGPYALGILLLSHGEKDKDQVNMKNL